MTGSRERRKIKRRLAVSWSKRRWWVSRVGWRRRLAKRGRAGLGVPAARRRGDVVCSGIRLYGFEFHQRFHRGGERGRVHLADDFVALCGGVRVALLSGKRQPQPRLPEVLFDAKSARVKDREIVLAVADAKFGCPSEPFHRFGIVRGALARLGAHDRKIVRGPRIAGLSRLEVPALGSRRIAGHANSFLVHRAKPILRWGQAERGGTFEPPRRR